MFVTAAFRFCRGLGSAFGTCLPLRICTVTLPFFAFLRLPFACHFLVPALPTCCARTVGICSVLTTPPAAHCTVRLHYLYAFLVVHLPIFVLSLRFKFQRLLLRAAHLVTARHVPPAAGWFTARATHHGSAFLVPTQHHYARHRWMPPFLVRLTARIHRAPQRRRLPPRGLPACKPFILPPPPACAAFCAPCNIYLLITVMHFLPAVLSLCHTLTHALF